MTEIACLKIGTESAKFARICKKESFFCKDNHRGIEILNSPEKVKPEPRLKLIDRLLFILLFFFLFDAPFTKKRFSS